MNNYEAMPLTDIQLVKAARKDTQVEAMLLRRLYPKIFHIAWAITGNRELAEEATQIAALEVLKSLQTFRGIGSLESWSGSIARRVSLKVIKKKRSTEQTFKSLESIDEISDESAFNSTDTEHLLIRKRMFQDLLNKLENIPQKRRVSLLLHLAHDYTVSEVAELTNVSPNTVKDRLRTAYKELRAILKEHPDLQAGILEEIS
ncbi:MAG: sigma-70 family RNA polymerase sigma factor [Deltaproteobacteria bacterium]|nr:sigma-70 family RNA polymerase sigma factor [Deltaproteobacteria bacterium]